MLLFGLFSDGPFLLKLTLNLQQRLCLRLCQCIIILTILSGLSALIYYEWFALIFADFFIFDFHLDWDLILSIVIIIHVGASSKFFLIRKKITHWSADILILVLSISLIFGAVYLNTAPGPAPFQVKIEENIYDFD